MKALAKDNTRGLRLLPVGKQEGVRAWSRGWELNPPQSSVCWMFTAGCCELAICSPPPEPFGLRWKSLTKASPTPALRSLAPGDFDGSTIALYKASRKFGVARLPLRGLFVVFCNANSWILKEFDIQDAFLGSLPNA